MVKDGVSEFLSSEKEHEKWHQGIYDGIKAGFKRHRPDRIYEDLQLSDQSFRTWYEEDGHYHDIPYLATFTLSKSAELGALYAGKTLLL